MNNSFEYIDIILLAMIAGFIFLRLRGILGKKTGFEGNLSSKFQEEFRAIEVDLQQRERDLLAKRELMAKDEYDKFVTEFQARVSSVQKEIQYKRQSIDNAYQKALSNIRRLAMEVITKSASERKIDLVLKRDASVIFLPHLNISDEVLTRLNERTKNARIEVEIKKPVAK